MKKLLLIISILIIGIQLKAQSKVELRLGLTFNEIRTEVPETTTHYGELGKHLKQISEVTTVFYFFKEDICKLQVYTYHPNVLSSLLKSFQNDKFIKMSSSEYMYTGDGYIYKYSVKIIDGILMLFVEEV